MALAIFCIWLFFVIAFVLVRVFFPELAVKRSKKEIKAARVYDDFGYDERGFSALGYHRNGTRYDDEGYDLNGLDKEGKPRPVVQYGEGQPTMPIQKRKAVITAILIPLAVVLIVVPIINFAVNDSCLLGHNPIRTFCETPIKCTKCEKEIDDAPGHVWQKDAQTGEDICTECRAIRSKIE